MQKYKLIDRDTDEIVQLTVEEILTHINDDLAHSDEWTPYDVTDWVEGLLEFGSYDLILEADMEIGIYTVLQKTRVCNMHTMVPTNNGLMNMQILHVYL